MQHPEGILAFVYLEKENDEKNKCLLSASELTLISRGNSKKINLKEIRSVSFTHKLLLFPIVVGGAFGPFFFLALLGNYLPPVISLMGFFSSVFLFYYGYSGKHAIRIETINDAHEVFLSAVSDNLRSFRGFVVNFIQNNPGEDNAFLFFIPISAGESENLAKTGYWKLDRKGVFGYSFRDLPSKTAVETDVAPSGYLEVDIRKENLEVRYEKDATGLLKPRFYGEIKRNSK